MGQALFNCLDQKIVLFSKFIFAYYFIFCHGEKEFILRRREGEKFKNSLATDLQALCQSLGLVSACAALVPKVFGMLANTVYMNHVEPIMSQLSQL
jgi:hypothetical protein